MDLRRRKTVRTMTTSGKKTPGERVEGGKDPSMGEVEDERPGIQNRYGDSVECPDPKPKTK